MCYVLGIERSHPNSPLFKTFPMLGDECAPLKTAEEQHVAHPNVFGVPMWSCGTVPVVLHKLGIRQVKLNKFEYRPLLDTIGGDAVLQAAA